MTDEFIFAKMVNDPDKLRQLISYIPDEDATSDDDAYTDDRDAPQEDAPPTGHPVSGSRVSSTGKPYLYGTQRRRTPSWLL
jgi:hypothetical protein